MELAEARDILAAALNDVEEHVLEAMPTGAPLVRELLRQGDAVLMHVDRALGDPPESPPDPEVSREAAHLVGELVAAVAALNAPRRYTRSRADYEQRYRLAASSRHSLLLHLQRLEAAALRGARIPA